MERRFLLLISVSTFCRRLSNTVPIFDDRIHPAACSAAASSGHRASFLNCCVAAAYGDARQWFVPNYRDTNVRQTSPSRRPHRAHVSESQKHFNRTGPRHGREPGRDLFLCRAIGVDEVSRLVLRRPYDHPLFRVDQLADVVAGQVLPLADDRARLDPLAVRPERDLADDGR